MAFNIELYKCLNDPKTVPKSLSGNIQLIGTLRNESSIIDPVILIEADIATLSSYNYCIIPSFSRFYFIQDMVSVRTSLVELHCHVDVLQTYRDQYMRINCIIERQANYYNLYLNDGVFKAYQNPQVITKTFPNGLTNNTFVLLASGPVSAPT